MNSSTNYLYKQDYANQDYNRHSCHASVFNTYINGRMKDKLQKSFGKILYIFKKSSKNNNPNYKKAIQALKNLKYNEAINLFTQILKEYPNSYSIRCDRAYAAYQIGDWNRAINDLNYAISKKPKKTRAYSLRGEVYRLRSMYEKALGDLNKSLKIQKCIFALRSRAEIYISTQRYKEALLDLDLALGMKPQNVFIIVRRAKIYCLLGLYNKALKDLNYALELDTTNAVSLLVNRSDIYRIIGYYDLALADLESALRYEESIMVLERRGMIYKALDKRQDALSDFGKILQKEPLNFNAHKNKAEILIKMENYKEAQMHMNIALQIEPLDFQLLKNQGEVYHSLGYYDDAIKSYTLALKIDPNYVKKRSEIYRLLYDFEKA
ncbi:15109_t:CDS:2 [Gigaspora margarita]|uniref:15109_t:CDS:1 n=1 Tax=Gigaspora margarita TaxID=4874 RepID=A0ABN7V5M1_GIGMA|nr:15109_t:CDS:2 [Gigaspora margarita]